MVVYVRTFSQVTLESRAFSHVMLELSHGILPPKCPQHRNLAFSHLTLRWKSQTAEWVVNPEKRMRITN